MNNVMNKSVSEAAKGVEISIVCAAGLYYCGSIFRGNYLNSFGISGLINDSVYTTMYYGSLPILETCMICAMLYFIIMNLMLKKSKLPYLVKYILVKDDKPDTVISQYRTTVRVLFPIAIFVFIAIIVSATMAKLSSYIFQIKQENISLLLDDKSVIIGRQIASDENHVALLLDGSKIMVVSWPSVRQISL